MGMGFAPTWLRQVSPLLHKTALTTGMHIQLLVYSRISKITTSVTWELHVHLEASIFSIGCAKNYKYRFQFLQVIEN